MLRAAGIALAATLLALTGCHRPKPHHEDVSQQRSPVQLTAADGTHVYGDYIRPSNARAVILLFHQAGSGQGEYATIAPRLAEAGYATLAIDQRAGGDLFGGNFTVREYGKQASYLDAKQDLEAALKWARGEKLPVVLWGSSYSASLIFLVAAEHPNDATALLAFSPGEYFDGKPSVAEAAAKLKIPVFVTSAQQPGEIAAATAIADAVTAPGKRLFVPTQGGVHGSSTLIKDRNPNGADAVWKAVMPFLDWAAQH